LTLSPSEQWILSLVAGITVGLQAMLRTQTSKATTSQPIPRLAIGGMGLAT
jgi:hypothetical protein